MNTTLFDFRDFIRKRGMDECEAMNRLQDHGLVSDCAVFLKDCAPSDLERAMIRKEWME